MIKTTSIRRSLIFCFLTSALVASAADTTVEITPFAGYGMGGEFQETTTDSKLDVQEEGLYGLTVDWGQTRARQFEFFLSHQPTKLTSSSGTAPPAALTDLDITYAHIGGALNFGDNRVSPFFGGGLGLTHFSPGGDYGSETKFSISLAGGVKLFLTDHIGFRFEGRGLGTLVDNNVWFSSGSGGTAIAVSGDAFWQFQLNAGLIFAF